MWLPFMTEWIVCLMILHTGGFLVGLWLPNHCNGKPYCHCWQQYMEQYTHCYCGHSYVISREASMGDLSLFGCQICSCCIWRLVSRLSLVFFPINLQFFLIWRTIHSLNFKSGLVGYSSDDINKFLWMVRIGGGVFPHIKEPDYLVSILWFTWRMLHWCSLLFFHMKLWIE